MQIREDSTWNFKVNKRSLLLSFVALAFGHAHAQIKSQAGDINVNSRSTLTAKPPESQPPLDLKTAVQKALDNNNQIKTARALIVQDRADRNVVRGLIMPTISGTLSAGELKSAAITGVNNAFGGDPYNSYSAALNISQPIFRWGALSAIRVKDYSTKINELDLEVATRTLTQEVITSFYSVLLNQKLLHILERTEAVINESLATAQNRLHTGRGQLLDLLSVKTQLAALKPQIEQAHNSLETAGAQLATYLAEEGKYELQLRGALRGLQLQDIQKRMDFSRARLPELERIKAQRESLQEAKDAAIGQFFPSVNFTGAYGYSSYTRGELFSDYGNQWSMYLTLSVPIFEGLQSIYTRRSYAEQDHELDYQGRDLENTLALNQVSSLKTLQSTGASLVSAEEAADLADQSMAEARREYRLATIDFLQFLQVEQSMLNADQTLENTKYQNVNAFSAYFVATGLPLDTLVDILQERSN